MENNDDKFMKDVFQRSKEENITPPYLHTQCKALLDAHDSKLSFRKKTLMYFSAGSFAVLTLVFVVSHPQENSIYHSRISQNTNILFDQSELAGDDKKYVKIELSNHIYFSSKKHQDLQKMTSLTFPSELLKNKNVPIIVKAMKSGIYDIRISYYNSVYQRTDEKNIHVQFDSSHANIVDLNKVMRIAKVFEGGSNDHL